jgi:uncharacterized protein YjdB
VVDDESVEAVTSYDELTEENDDSFAEFDAITFVELPSAADVASGIKTATLEDRAAEGKLDPVIKDYKATAEAVDEEHVIVKLSGSDLKMHQNAEGMNAYWLGVKLPEVPEGAGYTVEYYSGYDAPSADSEYEAPQADEDPDFVTFYFGRRTAIPFKPFYISAWYKELSPGGALKQDKIVNIVVDATGITFDNCLPNAEDVTAIKAAPIHDNAGKLPDKDLASEYGIGKIEFDEEDNEYTIYVTARDLKKHQAGNGAVAYWVGVAIPQIIIDGVDALDVKAEAGWKLTGEYAPINTVRDDVWTDEESKITYDTFYFNAKSKNEDALDENGNVVGHISIKYTAPRGEEAVYNFAVDMSGVFADNGLPSLEELVAGVKEAPLEDNAKEGKITKLYDTYGICEIDTEEYGIADVYIEATGLKQHEAGNGVNAYWVGIAIPRPKNEEAQIKALTTWDLGKASQEDFDNVENVRDSYLTDGEGKITHDTFYFNGDYSKHSCGYLLMQYTFMGEAVTYAFYINFYDVYLDRNLPELTGDVIAAPLHDESPDQETAIADGDLYENDTYKVEKAEVITEFALVPIKVKGLKKHHAGNPEHTQGYWVGFGIPKTDMEGIETRYYQSYTEIKDPYEITEWKETLDSEVTVGDKTYATVYFDAGRNDIEDKAGYVYVKYTAPRGDSIIYTYFADFDEVKLDVFDNIDPKNVVAATLEDHPADEKDKITKLYDEYGITNKFGIGDNYTLIVKAKNLRAHANGRGENGYWMGVGFYWPKRDDKDSKITTKYYMSYDTPADKNTLFHEIDDDSTEAADVVDGKSYLSMYFNALSLKEAEYFPEAYAGIEYISEDGTSVRYYYTIYFNVDGVDNDFPSSEEMMDVIAAKPVDKSETPVTDLYTKYELGEVTEDEEYPGEFDVPVIAENLVRHTAGNGELGYWAGIGVPVVEKPNCKVEYAQSYEFPDWDDEEYFNKVAWKDALDSEIAEGEKLYKTAYFDVADERLVKYYDDDIHIEGCIFVKYTSTRDPLDYQIYVYYVSFDNSSLASTMYGVSIEETVNDLGVLIQDITRGEITLTLTATELNEDGTPTDKPAVNVDVEWISTDPDLAMVEGDRRTDKDGKATATVSFLGEGKCGSVAIIGWVDGLNLDYVNYELYSKYTVTDQGAIEMHLPKECMYSLKPTFELPEKSEYELVWISSDPEIAQVYGNGLVYAETDGEVYFYHAIADKETHEPVNAFGVPASNALISEEGVYKATIETPIESVDFRSFGEVYAWGRQELYIDMTAFSIPYLELEFAPAEFDISKVKNVKWTCSDYTKLLLLPGTIMTDGNMIQAYMLGGEAGEVMVTADITTVTGQNFKATTLVSILPTVIDIAIGKQGTVASKEAYAVKKGNNLKLWAEVTAPEFTDTTVEWVSMDPDVAKISENGLVTALETGTAEIRARVPDFGYKAVRICVYDDDTKISIDTDNIVLWEEDEVIVHVDRLLPDYLWTSSDTSIVTVLQDTEEPTSALLTGVKKGKAVITVKDQETGISTSFDVLVGTADDEVELESLTTTKSEYKLWTGCLETLEFTANPDNATNIIYKWTSDNENVVRVSDSGVIECLAKGEATVTLEAVMFNGLVNYDTGTNETVATGKKLEYRIVVDVPPKAEAISIEPRNVELTAPLDDFIPGETAVLSYKIYPENVTQETQIWHSSDENVATVYDGWVSAVNPGVALITLDSFYDENGNGVPDTEDGTEVISASQSIWVTVKYPVSWSDYFTDRYDPEGVWIGLIPDQLYTGSAIKPTPNVYYGSVLLEPGTDYTLTYKNNINAARNKNEPTVTVNLKGNYSGKVSQTFAIEPVDLNEGPTVNNVSAVVKTGKNGIQEQFLNPTITYNGKVLKVGTDYDLFYLEDDEKAYGEEGVWEITVIGKGNFIGEIQTYEILIPKDNALNISKAKITGVEKKYKYTGEEISPDFGVTYNGKVLEYAVDYLATFSDNIGLGTATVTITGMGQFYGTKKQTFKIYAEKKSIANGTFEVSINGGASAKISASGTAATSTEITYLKGGVKPEYVQLFDQDGEELILRDEFTWTNKADPKKGIGTVTIKGKGSFFTGKATATYKIVNSDINYVSVVPEDFVFTNKTDAYKKAKLAVYDVDGKVLKAGTDYTVNYEADSPIPQVGDYVRATITGKGFYSGYDRTGSSTLVTFRVIEKSQSISNATYAFMVNGEEIPSSKFYVKYAGTPVVLDKSDILIKVRKKVGRTVNIVTLDESDIEIAAVQNNNKVGTATFIIKGYGEYGGTKAVKVKIKK